MNTRPLLESESHPIALSASFNQDASRFAIGHEGGFCVFTSDPCMMQTTRDLYAGIGAAQMLDTSNFVALVGGGKQPKYPQNKLIIYDDSKQKPILQIPVLTTIQGVKLTRTHIVIVLQNSVRIYKFQSKPELWAAFETSDNPLGLCCLATRIVAFPGRTTGQVQVVELETGNVSIIPAHTSALRAIDISRDGNLLATASTAGTLIRVFATSNCGKLAELRRGVDYAIIFAIAFSPSGQQLAVTSNKSTLHIFDVPHPSSTSRQRSVSPSIAEEAPQKWGFLSKIPCVPRLFSDTYSFASAHFEMGDEPLMNPANPDSGPLHPKGVLGWLNGDTVIVIGCGQDARWEKFCITEGDDGKRFCYREGWKRYLGKH